MKAHPSLFVPLLAACLAGSARSEESVVEAGHVAHSRPVRLLAPSDTVERLEADSHEVAAVVRVLREADFAFVTDLSDMEVELAAVQSGRRHGRFLVQYQPSTDHDGLLLRVMSRDPTGSPKTMMDLEYRRVADSADFRLVRWRPVRLALRTEPVDLRSD